MEIDLIEYQGQKYKPNYYFVTEDGKIWRRYKTRPPKEITGSLDKHGYIKIHLIMENGQGRTFAKHRVIMNALRPTENPEQYQINHIDFNRTNNHPDNLEWCSASENTKWSYDAERIKLPIGKAKNPGRKKQFDEAQIKEIRARVAAGESQGSVARDLKADRATISRIINHIGAYKN